MTDEAEVWSTLLDKRYKIEVTRTSPYRGQLVIFDTYLSSGAPGSTVMLSKPVGLMYDALFGPDVDDVMNWQQTAIEFVDGLTKGDGDVPTDQAVQSTE